MVLRYSYDRSGFGFNVRFCVFVRFYRAELFFGDKKINDKCRLFLVSKSFMLIILVFFLAIFLASFLVTF